MGIVEDDLELCADAQWVEEMDVGVDTQSWQAKEWRLEAENIIVKVRANIACFLDLESMLTCHVSIKFSHVSPMVLFTCVMIACLRFLCMHFIQINISLPPHTPSLAN